MFDIGFAELLIIAVVALVVLGPEKLPHAVRTAGMWFGRARRTLRNIQSDISEELRMEELNRKTEVTKQQLDAELFEMRQPFVTKPVEPAEPVAEVPSKDAPPPKQDTP